MSYVVISLNQIKWCVKLLIENLYEFCNQNDGCAFFWVDVRIFFVSVYWQDPNNRDMNRIITQNVTCICSLWSQYSIEGSYDVTSGLLPFLSHVKIPLPKIFIAPKDSP